MNIATTRAHESVLEEMSRQDDKFGADREQPDYVWLLILVEEAGEVAKAILDRMFRHGPISDVDMEIIHTTAVGMQWLKSINKDKSNGTDTLPGEEEQMKRLELIEMISPRCSWSKHTFQCGVKEFAARSKYRELMFACAEWEEERGL